jgi:LisH
MLSFYSVWLGTIKGCTYVKLGISPNSLRKTNHLLSDITRFGFVMTNEVEAQRLTICSDRHINLLVMDYLVREGYPKAAQRFATEANIQSDANLDSIHERVDIRNLIYAGDIETAISRINELNPQVSVLFDSTLAAMIILVSCTTHKALCVDEKQTYFSPQNEPTLPAIFLLAFLPSRPNSTRSSTATKLCILP